MILDCFLIIFIYFIFLYVILKISACYLTGYHILSDNQLTQQTSQNTLNLFRARAPMV